MTTEDIVNEICDLIYQANIESWSTENKIKLFSAIFSLDPVLSLSVAHVESSMGKNQLSPTGAKGVFQMTTIAMKDLLNEMEKHDDDLIDISAGCAFLRTLKRRWGMPENIVKHYCDPKEQEKYWKKVQIAMDSLVNANRQVTV